MTKQKISKKGDIRGFETEVDIMTSKEDLIAAFPQDEVEITTHIFLDEEEVTTFHSNLNYQARTLLTMLDEKFPRRFSWEEAKIPKVNDSCARLNSTCYWVTYLAPDKCRIKISTLGNSERLGYHYDKIERVVKAIEKGGFQVESGICQVDFRKPC